MTARKSSPKERICSVVITWRKNRDVPAGTDTHKWLTKSEAEEIAAFYENKKYVRMVDVVS